MKRDPRPTRQVYAIDYQGARIELGPTWPEVSAAVDQALPSPKLAAALKLCLFERLKDRLKLGPVELEGVLAEYAGCL